MSSNNDKKVVVNGKLEKPIEKTVVSRSVDWQKIAKEKQEETANETQ